MSILVNSAGIAGKNATVEDYDPDEWRKVVEINLNGTFYVNKVVIPSMKARNYGRIVNISSVAGKKAIRACRLTLPPRPACWGSPSHWARNWPSTTSP